MYLGATTLKLLHQSLSQITLPLADQAECVGVGPSLVSAGRPRVRVRVEALLELGLG